MLPTTTARSPRPARIGPESSPLHSGGQCRLDPFCLIFHDFVRGVKTRGFLDHRSDGAVLFLGEADRLLEGRYVDVKAGNDVMNANRGEYLRRTIGLIGLYPDFVAGHLLVILLPK